MLSLRIATPLSSPSVHEIVRLDTAITQVQWTTTITGGFGSATVTIAPGRRYQIPAGAHCEIFQDGNLVFEGMRRLPTLVGKDLTQIQIAGYATALGDASVMKWQPVPNETQYPAATCLEYAMSTQPLLRMGRPWQSPAVYHALSIFLGQNLWQVAQRLGTESGYDWAVWDGRLATFRARLAPSVPDYVIPEEQITNWQEDDSNIWTRVSVAYTDVHTGQAAVAAAPNGAPFTNTRLEAALGYVRETRLSGGAMDAGGAAQLAQTYLAQHATPAVSATIGPYPFLARPYGAPTPGPYVRAGQWCELQNRNFGTDTGTTSGGVMLPIVQTTHDMAGNCVAMLGNVTFSMVGRLLTLEQVSRATKAGLNPVSGAPH